MTKPIPSDASSVADVLIEALPYIRKFAGMTVVVKYGGHAMVDDKLKADFSRDVVLLKVIGLNPVVVHGGGPQINRVLDRMGISPKFVRGMRMTDADTMDVVEMVLGGKVNKDIVAQINRQGGRAAGLSGKDGGLIQARKMKIVLQEDDNAPPEIIDPGLVGEVTRIDATIIDTLTGDGFIPVIAPVGIGANGETYNINADLVAGHVARALSAGRLYLMTDVDGVLDGDGRLVSSMTTESARQMIAAGDIKGGMIPKIECALETIAGGVQKVAVINGKRRHALLLELFTDRGIGTEVTM
jgi:acetylglutamate kinase